MHLQSTTQVPGFKSITRNKPKCFPLKQMASRGLSCISRSSFSSDMQQRPNRDRPFGFTDGRKGNSKTDEESARCRVLLSCCALKISLKAGARLPQHRECASSGRLTWRRRHPCRDPRRRSSCGDEASSCPPRGTPRCGPRSPRLGTGRHTRRCARCGARSQGSRPSPPSRPRDPSTWPLLRTKPHGSYAACELLREDEFCDAVRLQDRDTFGLYA